MTIPTPANHDPARLGRYVREHREARGLSLRGLARTAGIDKVMVHRIESGTVRSPDPRILEGLARALEVDLADLYLEAGLPLPQQLPSMKPYLRATSDLPDDAIDQIAAYVDFLAERTRRKEDGHDDAANAA